MRTIAINIEKGGAGKTTVACHLAWHLADAGHRVLFLDLDRQRNASDALAGFVSMGSVKPLFEPGFTPPSELPKLAIMMNDMRGEYDGDYPRALTNIQDNLPRVADAFDFCVIDTPPSWSWINFAALLVCDDLIVPIELGPFGLPSTQQVSNSIATVNKHRDAPIHIVGLLPNRVRANNLDHMQLLTALHAKIGKNLFTAYLPERAHYSQALQAKVPVWRFRKDVRGSVPAMKAFLEEAMTRMGIS